MGRATNNYNRHYNDRYYFNPRPPWGGRHYSIENSLILLDISIHALRGEGDICNRRITTNNKSFQSTPSVGRATYMVLSCMIVGIFQSTPSVGRATLYIKTPPKKRSGNFNPRPPWGGRHYGLCTKNQRHKFQSTPSVGRATLMLKVMFFRSIFQSTPSVGRATVCSFISKQRYIYFNPRPPWGGRLILRYYDII